MIPSQLARKMLALRRIGQATRKFSDHHEVVPEKYKHLQRLTMNEGSYPLPKELHADAYARRQAKNNKFLALSVLFLGSAIIFVTTQETFAFLAPPPRKVLNWQ